MRKLFSLVLIVLLMSTFAVPVLAGVDSELDPVQQSPSIDGGLLGRILFYTANRTFEQTPTIDGGLVEAPTFIKVGIAIINAFVDLLNESATEDILR
jgi:hypothetical protein